MNCSKCKCDVAHWSLKDGVCLGCRDAESIVESIPARKTVFAYFHHSEIELPLECVIDCTQQGANDDAVDCWQRTCADIKFPGRAEMLAGLRECGAWDQDELNALNDDELEQKVLWVACHDAREEMRNANERSS